MSFVVITKRVSDFAEVPTTYKGTSASYPLEVKEYATAEEAQDAHPGSTVLSSEYYNGYKLAMNDVHGVIKSVTKSWWQFWK